MPGGKSSAGSDRVMQAAAPSFIEGVEQEGPCLQLAFDGGKRRGGRCERKVDCLCRCASGKKLGRAGKGDGPRLALDGL